MTISRPPSRPQRPTVLLCHEDRVIRRDRVRLITSPRPRSVLGWTPAVNSAWVQGGIDRNAIFYLGLPSNASTILHPVYNITMYAKELEMLRTAGYVPMGPYLVRAAQIGKVIK